MEVSYAVAIDLLSAADEIERVDRAVAMHDQIAAGSLTMRGDEAKRYLAEVGRVCGGHARGGVPLEALGLRRV